MKKCNSIFILVAAMAVWTNVAFADINSLGVVKYSKGNVRVTQGAVERELKGSDLIAHGEKVASGQEGKAVVRLLPDQAFLEIRPKTTFVLKRVKTKDGQIRRVVLTEGEVVFGLKKKSLPIQCDNTQTQATARMGRFACKSDGGGTAMILVQDGEVSVYNRPKDIIAVVRSGQKAVSDGNGVKVSDATDSELEQVGFRQNTIEVDFINPESEEYTTLEVEYETNF